MKRKFKLFHLLGLLMVLSAEAFGAEIWVVSGANLQAESVDQQLVKSAFLGKPARTNQGVELKAIERKETVAGLRSSFYQSVLELSTSQVKAYWSQMMFTGRGYPPPVMDDLQALKKALNETPGSISYIDSTEMDSSFKVLQKFPRS